MSDYREECIRHKNVQRGIEEERAVGGSKKAGRKPYLLECRFFKQWGWSGRYADLKTANQAFDNHARKRSWPLRLVLDGVVIRTTEVAPSPPSP